MSTSDNRQELVSAARAMCLMLSKHVAAFERLATFGGSATDANFTIIHAQAYAELYARASRR